VSRAGVRHLGGVALLAALLAGCATSLTPLTAEQAAGLKEAQRIADRVTKAYGVPGVKVYAAALGPSTAGTYSYHYDWIFIRPESLTGKRLLVLISHELGHATLGHGRGESPSVDRERQANRRGVEILVKFLGLSEQEALDTYATYLIAAHKYRHGRDVLIPAGHLLPCEELRELWTGFGQTAPACETVTAAPKPSTQ
jgi:hypothetical protein